MANNVQKLTVLEVDAATGIETVRDLTTQEIADLAAMKIEIEARQDDQEAKAAARASALAKLADLGLTAEEIAAL